MLCDDCQARNANVFLTEIVNGNVRQRNLCDPCAAPILQVAQARSTRYAAGGFGSGSPEEDWAPHFVNVDSRYPAEAYRFVMRAVRAAAATTPPASGGHVAGPAIAEAFRQLALAEFGSGALAQLAEWRIASCDDIGAIVFRMVERGVFGARSEDRPEDFHGLYNFVAAFPTSV